jgi:glutamate synthase (NADPH/NADH) small chain
VGDNGAISGVKVADTEIVDGKRQPKQGTERVLPADLVFLALGFTGPENQLLKNQSEIMVDNRGNIARNSKWATNLEDVFVAGDAGRGQSLIVWAIAEGRAAAAAIDEWLTGETVLPKPVRPTDRAISI